MTRPYLPAMDALEILREIAAGRIGVDSIWPRQFEDGDHADLYVMAGGHRLVIFNDGGDLDYLDNMTSADGRHGKFEQWVAELGGSLNDPIRMLSGDDEKALMTILAAAPVAASRSGD
ncbi:MAG: hypothetical protein IH626_22900 [Rhodospirillales bacterium]|nr:hypothetical protein [Rhodospirillales bacterium]